MQEVEFYYPDELTAAMKDADTVAANAKQEGADPPGDSDDTVKVGASILPDQLRLHRCRPKRSVETSSRLR
jgi:hypothetical protein